VKRPNLITSERIPMSIPKKKRAQLIRIQQEKARKQLKHFYLTWEPQTMKFVTPYNASAQKCAMTQGFADVLKRLEVNWRIHCYILAREKNGKNRLECQTIDIDTPCKHDDISQLAADIHWNMIEEFRKSNRADNFVTAAWIANMKDDVPEDLAYKIFEDCGAWEINADWEEDQ